MAPPITYLLDTHAWIWMNSNPNRLSHRVRKLLSSSSDLCAISVVSIVELGTLSAKGRVNLMMPIQEWIEEAVYQIGLSVLPLNTDVAMEAGQLPGNFHFDPADRIIAATARIHHLSLITIDRHIHAYPHVKTIW